MKLKCTSCKQFLDKGEFFETTNPTSKKRGCYTYWCKKCNKDAVLVSKVKRKGSTYIKTKLTQYGRLISLYKKALEKCDENS